MTNHITAMKQALETLEGWDNYGDWVWPETALEQCKRNTKESLAALRQAIEQAKKQQALDKKADNARELGLDYEPSRAQTKQIAEGLKHCHHPDSEHEFLRVWIRDWTAHKSTPSQAEKQEPVAWVANINLGAGLVTKSIDFCRSSNPIATHTPLYTAPPRNEWVGLTDEEIEDCVLGQTDQRNYWIKIGKAIEAKLKEKNNGN